MNFRYWLESQVSIEDLEGTSNTPPEWDEEAIRLFTQSMMYNWQKYVMVAVSGGIVKEQLYRYPIGKNLLLANHIQLGYAIGELNNIKEPEFSFKTYNTYLPAFGDEPEYNSFKLAENTNPKRNEVGSIIIRFPPVHFNEESAILLESIIRHEVTHAYDWIKEDIHQTEEYWFDKNKYTVAVQEANGYFQQLQFLIKEIGDIDRILHLLKTTDYLGVADLSIMSVIEAYLKSLPIKEYLVSKTNMELAADVLVKLAKCLLFKNFVRRK